MEQLTDDVITVSPSLLRLVDSSSRTCLGVVDEDNWTAEVEKPVQRFQNGYVDASAE